MERYGATLNCADEVLETLVTRYNDPGTGGRAIEQALAQTVLPKIAAGCLAKLIESESFSNVAMVLSKDESTIEVEIS